MAWRHWAGCGVRRTMHTNPTRKSKIHKISSTLGCAHAQLSSWLKHKLLTAFDARRASSPRQKLGHRKQCCSSVRITPDSNPTVSSETPFETNSYGVQPLSSSVYPHHYSTFFFATWLLICRYLNRLSLPRQCCHNKIQGS